MDDDDSSRNEGRRSYLNLVTESTDDGRDQDAALEF